MSIPTQASPFRRALSLAAMSLAFVLPAFAADLAPSEAQARFEVDYLTDLIDQRQVAVEVAQLVEERTERPELRDLADELATAQAKEITTLQGWLQDWYGEEHEPELERRAERLVATLEDLEGDEFEQAFLRALTLHDADALTVGRRGLLRAWHTELIDLTRETVATQADEIALFRGYLAEWHDINEVLPGDWPDNRKWNKATIGPRIPVKAPPGGP
jgi:uncharacterized protein (DUF305 family)